LTGRARDASYPFAPASSLAVAHRYGFLKFGFARLMVEKAPARRFRGVASHLSQRSATERFHTVCRVNTPKSVFSIIFGRNLQPVVEF
jgi:hypothetical protein